MDFNRSTAKLVTLHWSQTYISPTVLCNIPPCWSYISNPHCCICSVNAVPRITFTTDAHCSYHHRSSHFTVFKLSYTSTNLATRCAGPQNPFPPPSARCSPKRVSSQFPHTTASHCRTSVILTAHLFGQHSSSNYFHYRLRYSNCPIPVRISLHVVQVLKTPFLHRVLAARPKGCPHSFLTLRHHIVVHQ